MKRANAAQLQHIFEKYASATIEGQKYMTDVDFFVNFLGLFPENNYDKHSARYEISSARHAIHSTVLNYFFY